MEQAAEQIRAAVRGLRRPSASTPYPRQLRARVTAHVRRRRGEGAAWADVAAEVGISVYTLRDWLEKDAGPGRAARMRNAECGVRNEDHGGPASPEERAEALIPVRVRAEAAVAVAAGTLELLTPKGYRLSGLTAVQALELLKALG